MTDSQINNRDTNKLLVEKLASRILAWRHHGVERSPEAEAMDYIEFVTTHLSNKHPNTWDKDYQHRGDCNGHLPNCSCLINTTQNSSASEDRTRRKLEMHKLRQSKT